MNYTVFLLPNTCLSYPHYVISLMEIHVNSAFVITLDKRFLQSVSSHAFYLERCYGEKGEHVVPVASILEQIQEKKPTLIVLDNCFWDDTSDLLDELLQSSLPYFHLINVLQLEDAKHANRTTRLERAEHVLVPSWIPWLNPPVKTTEYENQALCPICPMKEYDDLNLL